MISSHYKLSEELLRDADIAMYRAKRQGSSGYHIFPINLANSQVVNNQSVNSTISSTMSQRSLVPKE
jgi:GGDEF domain-containing protein